MNLLSRNAGKKTRGQTMVEFALVLPILLMTMYGVMEFGRLLFIYVTTTSASREAARYASGVELVDRGGVLVERFRDCEGIRDAAMRVGLLAGIESGDVEIRYDEGPSDTTPWDNLDECPDSVSLGNRVRVSVTGHFQPIVPLVPWSEEVLLRLANIRSETARTIIRNVEVGPNFQPPPQDIGNTPPFVRFTSYSSWVNEHDYNEEPYTATVVVVDDENFVTPHDADLEIVYTVSGEATSGEDHDLFSDTLTIPANSPSADIQLNIIDDDLYEYLERIVIVLQSGASRRVPWAHVVYIQDNDSPPAVNFALARSVIYRDRGTDADPHQVDVVLGETAQAASVGFTITTTLQRDYDYSVDPDPETDRLYFPLTGPNFNEVITTARIFITPYLDVIPEGTQEIVLELVNPFNTFLGPTYRHVVELRDYYCRVEGSNPLVGNQEFRWDLDNIGDYPTNLERVTIAYTAENGARFNDVLLGSEYLWSDPTEANPVTVPIGLNWPGGGDPSINSGESKTLSLGFDIASVTSIDSVNLDFTNGCPSITFTPSP